MLVITFQKIVKYCTYCKWDYSTKDEYHDNYLQHKEVLQAISAKKCNKWKRNKKLVMNNLANLDIGKVSYLYIENFVDL